MTQINYSSTSFSARAAGILGIIVLLLMTLERPIFAHPVPFSYLDIRLGPEGIGVALVAHSIDLAHELREVSSEALLDPGVAQRWRTRLEELLRPRLRVRADSEEMQFVLGEIEVLKDRQALRFHLRFSSRKTPGVLGVRCLLFPYDPRHQTFVNVYEVESLKHQEILSKDRQELEYFTGSMQGSLAVVQKFVPSGIGHILVGPDHVLFVIGLLLLGGSVLRLLTIITAFTVAHSITLSLAALEILNLPARMIEPAIALSIVYVGIDNLLVGKEGRDARAWIAFFFGFIHGFGFANVLREFGLPHQALGWSLFSFNFGVEIGQICIVLVAASALAAIRGRNRELAQRIAHVGSACVIAAGVFWFVQRVFFVA